MRKRPSARNTPETKIPNTTPKAPPLDVKQPPKPVNPAPDPVKPPPKPVNPMPKPAEMPKLAWDKPIDPNGDCTFENSGEKLTITVPGTYHDLNVKDGRTDAPRMVRDVEGDFTAQVRVSGDFHPSTTSSAPGQDSFLGAGLVLWSDAKTLVRLERAARHKMNRVQDAHWEVWGGGQRKPIGLIFTRLGGEEAYLRLERRGDKVHASVSEDGTKWSTLDPLDIELPAKVKIGVAAISTSTTPFVPTFDQFQLKKGQGEMVRIELTLPSASEPVVVKPPRPSRFTNKMAVPDEQTLVVKRKLLKEERYKDEYEKMSKRALASKMYNDSKDEDDLSLCYVMLSEVAGPRRPGRRFDRGPPAPLPIRRRASPLIRWS